MDASHAAPKTGTWNIEASNWALDAMSDALLLYDRDYRILYANRAWSELAQMAVDEVVGKLRHELWPELTPKVLDEYDRAFASQEPISFTVFHELSHRWLDIRLHPSPNVLAVFFRDVSKEKAAEEVQARTRESEERFRAAVGAVGILWTNNAQGEMQGEQPGWASLTGQSQEEYQGYGWAEAVHPEDQKGSIESWSEAVAAKSTYEFEHRVRRFDGEFRRYAIRAVPVFHSDGTVREWVGVHADVTDVREIEENLRRTQRSLGLALKGGRMGWWTRDMATDEVTWSPELEAIFGLAVGSFHGTRQTFMNYVIPEDREAVTSAVRRSLQTGNDYAVEFRFRREDGVESWMEGRGIASYGPDGKPTAMYGIGMDIGDRKQAEVRMRQSEQRLRLSLAAAAAGIWHFDPNTGFAFWDEQCFLLYGLDPTGPVPAFEAWLDLIHPEDREQCRNGILFALHAGGDFRAEYRIRHPVLGERWLVTAGGVIDEDQTLTGITYDVTESKRQVALLEATVSLGHILLSERDPQRILQSLCDASTQAIGAQFGAFFYHGTDDDKLNLYVLSGAQPADFAGLRPREGQRPTFPKGATIRSDNILDDARYPEFGQIPEGHLPVRSYLGVPVRSRTGDLLGELIFGHAEAGRFTEKHVQLIDAFSAQAAVAYENSVLLVRLREAKDDLEQKVRHRTADLERANEQMQGFTYHVSHDLRSPLRAIVATSRMIQDDFGDVLNDDSRALLTRQATAANKLGQLIDDLLKLSRLEREAIEIRPVDLTALARESVSEIFASHPSSAATIEVEDDLLVNADHRLLKLAIVNLLENAVKYSPNGGTIRLGRAEDGSLFVSDEGLGVEAQYLERIFEPFQRLHRDQEFVGTGIGLTNVRQVITRHGGRVWAESEPGKGSTFRFTL